MEYYFNGNTRKNLLVTNVWIRIIITWYCTRETEREREMKTINTQIPEGPSAEPEVSFQLPCTAEVCRNKRQVQG